MDKIFVVFQVKLDKRNEEFMRHAFSTEEEARRFCDKFLYNSSTMEDRLNDKMHIDDNGRYIEYSMYTAFYGEITLRIRQIAFN